MFSKSANANDRRSSAVTIIGPSACIDGNIVFSGYLRVQGSVVGNVTCSSEATGTTVIHGAGSVAGTIKTPNIVVGGRVNGPLEATESIEIHEGAAVVGDARYKLLSIQEGGAIDGKLTPTAAAESAWPRQERRVAASDVPAIQQLDGPNAHDRRASDRVWGSGKILIAAMAIVAVGAFVWQRQDNAPAEPPQLAVAPLPEDQASSPASTASPAAPIVPPKVEAPLPAPKVEAAPPPAIVAEPPKADPGRTVTVQGMDLDKPADVFFVSTREPITLFKKLRTDTGDGTRIELGSGTQRRVAVSEDEVVRVARGTKLDLFYQGRKLSSSVVQSGAWISFQPLVEPRPAPAPQAE